MAAAEHRTERPRVIVVGGGLSGLTTAWRLLNLGVNVTILEASAHVGGRARSFETRSGRRVPVGGTWAAFECDELLSLAYEVDKLPFVSTTRLLYLSPTISTAPWLLIKLYYEGKRIIKEGKKAAANDPAPPGKKPVNRWWATKAAQELDAISLDEWLKRCKWCGESARECVREWFCNLETFRETGDISALYAAVMLYYRCKCLSIKEMMLSRRRPLRWDEGTGSLIDALRTAILSKSGTDHYGAATIHTHTMATQINHTPNHVTVTATTSNGTQTFEGDAVVVATSPPAAGNRPITESARQILGQGTLRYVPELRAEANRLMHAMVATEYPSMNIIMTYPTPWWREHGYGGLILPRHATEPPTGVFGLMMDITPRAIRGTPREGILRILTTPARVRGMDSEALRAAVIVYLKQYYPKHLHDLVENIQDIELYDWSTERPNLPGVTYYLRPGMLSLYGDWMCCPIGRIFFGGSERSLHGQNWMEGAVERGNRVAAEVAETLKLQKAGTLNKALFRRHTAQALEKIYERFRAAHEPDQSRVKRLVKWLQSWALTAASQFATALHMLWKFMREDDFDDVEEEPREQVQPQALTAATANGHAPRLPAIVVDPSAAGPAHAALHSSNEHQQQQQQQPALLTSSGRRRARSASTTSPQVLAAPPVTEEGEQPAPACTVLSSPRLRDTLRNSCLLTESPPPPRDGRPPRRKPKSVGEFVLSI